MTSIEHTAYPRFIRAPSVKELREVYTPSPGDVAFVVTHARGPAQKFALMILLKIYQRLHYFPDPQSTPRTVVDHLRAVMKLPTDLVPDISPATLYRYHVLLREHLEITSQGQHIRHLAARAMAQVAQVMHNPADTINAAIETVVNAHGELPAFSTLDRMARRIRTLVNGRIYQTILARLTAEEQEALLRILQHDEASAFTIFNRIKEAPKSATLTHLDEWLSRLTCLQSLGKMDRLIAGLPSTKIIHLAEEARALHASDFWDFTLPNRLALLVCLIHQATVSTRDEIAQMFLKRMSKLTANAKEELERLRTEDRATTEHLIEVLTEVLQINTDAPDAHEAGTQIRAVIERSGGSTQLLEQCEHVSAHHGDRYQPFVWRFYASHRKALFRVLKTLDFQSTTSDQVLMEAMHFLLAHEHDSKEYLEASIDLSLTSEKWQRTVIVRRKQKSWFVRQHLETCIFSYVAAELKTGDLCIAGSEQFVDYGN